MEVTSEGLLTTVLVLLSLLIVVLLGLLVIVGLAIHRSLLKLRLAAEAGSELITLAKNGFTKKAIVTKLARTLIKRKIRRR